MRILDSAGVASLERVVGDLGVAEVVLMENAALATVEVMARQLPNSRTVVVVCGPGANGGDGYAVARHLQSRGLSVRAFSTHSASGSGTVVRQQRRLAEKLGIEVQDLDDADPQDWRTAIASADVVIDAMLGTGLSRPLEGQMADWAETLSRATGKVVAVDVPSGLDASLATVPGRSVRADFTVTFFSAKVPHVLQPANLRCGEVWVSALGLPQPLIDEHCRPWEMVEHSDFTVRNRPSESHKGTYGHVLIVGGSCGMSGAAILASKAALRAGAGLVTAAVPDRALFEVMAGTTESMGVGLPMEGDGLSRSAIGIIEELWSDRDVVVLGPGLGRDQDQAAVVREVALACPLPLVLDADGISAFAGHAASLSQRLAPTVITPHPRELSVLVGRELPRGGDQRSAAALQAAEETGAVVVLKGHRTLVASPNGELRINPTGNPGMATAGSGDVLAGILSAELIMQPEPLDAAVRAVYIHGLAGDLAADFWGQEALVAKDLVAALPKAHRRVERQVPPKPFDLRTLRAH